jgi:phosphate-selective porin OprO/OprP
LLASAAAVALTFGGGSAYAARETAPKQPAPTINNIQLAQADTDASDASTMTVEERLERLEAKYAADHARLSTVEQNAADTSWSFDNARPTVKSGDGRFTMAVRVRFQFDDVNFFQKDNVNVITPTRNVQFKDLSSGTLVRRAFFGVEGKAFKDFWYEFRLNAGGGGNAENDPTLSLARIAYLGIPNFEINAGIIEPAFMYEGTTSSGQLMFMERPEIDNIAADSYGAGDGRRGIEFRFQKQGAFKGDDNLVLGGALTGAKTAATTGHGNGGDEQTQAIAHGSYRFWSDGASNAMFGGDYSHAFTGGCAGCAVGAVNPIALQDRPEFRVDGDRLVATGNINAKESDMWAVNAGANFNNFYLGGEYAHFSVDRLKAGARVADKPDFSGWYVEGSWVLTGEPKAYTVSATNNEVGGFGAPKVARPFSLEGDSWGAWELAARYSVTDLNWNQTHAATVTTQAGIPGGEEKVFLIGLNWYMNQNIKLQLNDAVVQVDKQASAGLTPAALRQVGQDLNILGVRMQFTN